MISYFPSETSQQPLCWSTEPRMWKNWFTLSLSLSPETELSFVNATFAKRDADERSPGSPIAPIPRLYVVSSALLPKLFSGCFGESDI